MVTPAVLLYGYTGSTPLVAPAVHLYGYTGSTPLLVTLAVHLYGYTGSTPLWLHWQYTSMVTPAVHLLSLLWSHRFL